MAASPADEPAPWEPVITRPDPMTAEEWEVLLEHDLAEDLDPEELQYEDDFLNPDADLTEAELAEIAAESEGLLLAGWSLGGVLAQAVAARLEGAGNEVALCALLDSVLPAERPELLERVAYRLGASLGPLAGRFEQAQQNEPATFLPGGAESVKVLEAAKEFPSGEQTPAVAVFRNPGGLGPRGRAAVEEKRAELRAASITGVSGVSPAAWSRDATAAVVAVPIKAGGDRIHEYS